MRSARGPETFGALLVHVQLEKKNRLKVSCEAQIWHIKVKITSPRLRYTKRKMSLRPCTFPQISFGQSAAGRPLPRHYYYYYVQVRTVSGSRRNSCGHVGVEEK